MAIKLSAEIQSLFDKLGKNWNFEELTLVFTLIGGMKQVNVHEDEYHGKRDELKKQAKKSELQQKSLDDLPVRLYLNGRSPCMRYQFEAFRAIKQMDSNGKVVPLFGNEGEKSEVRLAFSFNPANDAYLEKVSGKPIACVVTWADKNHRFGVAIPLDLVSARAQGYVTDHSFSQEETYLFVPKYNGPEKAPDSRSVDPNTGMNISIDNRNISPVFGYATGTVVERLHWLEFFPSETGGAKSHVDIDMSILDDDKYRLTAQMVETADGLAIPGDYPIWPKLKEFGFKKKDQLLLEKIKGQIDDSKKRIERLKALGMPETLATKIRHLTDQIVHLQAIHDRLEELGYGSVVEVKVEVPPVEEEEIEESFDEDENPNEGSLDACATE